MFYLFILAASAVINLIGGLGPEVGFDALWYHLVIPKLYIVHRGIYHIPGGLLYYSEMPRLTELAFLFINPHLIIWGAGIGAGIGTYLVARHWLERKRALLAVMIFYVTPLVGWLSGSGYVDLPRTLFEIFAFYFLMRKRPIWAGILLGLAISTKTLAIGSWGLLGILGIFTLGFRKTAMMALVAVFIGMPWFLAAYLSTGYPFYPVGAGILDDRDNLKVRFNSAAIDFWRLWLRPEDVVSPVYLMVLPFVFSLRRRHWLLAAYAGLSYLVWLVTPRTGGGRFILPYLPVWAVLAACIVDRRRFLVMVVIVVAIVNLGYRSAAVWRLKNVVLGREPTRNYLCRTLDFSTEVFADCDGWFAKNIRKTDLVLVRGYHNLYYLDFPFIHESWFRGEKVNYVLTFRQNYNSGRLVYSSELTGARVYRL